jgi:hypothetical protein
MVRRKLDISGDIAVQMAEGNLGALSVLTKLAKLPNMEGFGLVLDLDDMNLRGSQIYVAWKYHCNEDLEVFKKAVRDRDEAMIETVNSSQGHSPGTPRAVTGGASYRHTL